MNLITNEIKEKFNKYPLGSQDEKLGNAEVIAKFFNPTGIGTWYITEGQMLENGDAEMFGFCHLGDDEMAEFGTVMLSELESLQLPMGMTIERDLYMKEGIDLVQALQRDGIKIPNYIKESYTERTYEKTTIYEHESIIIAKPDSDIEKIINEYKDYFERIGNNVEIENIGVKKLAYEIKGLSEGNYVIFRYEAEKDKIGDTEKKFRLDDNIIKFLTVRNDPVIEDKPVVDIDDKNTIKLQRGKIYSYEDGLKQRVQEKLTNEYNDFINELKNERPQVILERAYEKVCKEEMLYAFEKKTLDVKECKALLKCPNILNDCYDEWLKSDGNFNEMLDYSIDNSIEHIVDDFKLEQKKKNKDSR